MIEYKSEAELELMRQAGIVVANTIAALREALRPGLSTMDLDEVARGVIFGSGATSNFLGYNGFPATICTSINSQIVHGIPSKQAIIRDGDIV
jgi:methionyl aminopeptidase